MMSALHSKKTEVLVLRKEHGFEESTTPVPEAFSHHALKVLRICLGEYFEIVSGFGHRASAKLIQHDNEIQLSIEKNFSIEQRMEPKIYVHQAHIRREKWEDVLRNATELEVFQISPLKTERIYSHDFSMYQEKAERFVSIIDDACRLSQKAFVPIINEPKSYEHTILELSKQCSDSFTAVLSPQSSFHSCTLFTQEIWAEPIFPKVIHLLIGPEGGFSSSELEFARENHLPIVHLGLGTLRTEHALSCAVSMIHGLKQLSSLRKIS